MTSDELFPGAGDPAPSPSAETAAATVDPFSPAVQFLPTLFKMLAETLPFTPPTTEQEMVQWFAAVAPFSPLDLREAGVRLAKGRRLRPTISSVVEHATLARDERDERRRNAETVMATSSGPALAQRRSSCPGCQLDVPAVALTRRRDGAVSARFCVCACYMTGERRYTRIVSFKQFTERRLDLNRINGTPAGTVDAMLGDWQPPHYEDRAYVKPAFDDARALMTEEP